MSSALDWHMPQVRNFKFLHHLLGWLILPKHTISPGLERVLPVSRCHVTRTDAHQALLFNSLKKALILPLFWDAQWRHANFQFSAYATCTLVCYFDLGSGVMMNVGSNQCRCRLHGRLLFWHGRPLIWLSHHPWLWHKYIISPTLGTCLWPIAPSRHVVVQLLDKRLQHSTVSLYPFEQLHHHVVSRSRPLL